MEESINFHQLFAPLGGILRRDRDDEFWEFVVGDYVVNLVPHLGHTFSGFHLALGCSISHRELSKLLNQILGTKADEFRSVKWDNQTAEITSIKEAAAAFREMLDDEFEQIKKMNIDQLIEEFRLSCPDGQGMRQVCHLAALAWAGDFNTLTDYQKSLERGHRLNFVPMIKREMIDRAIEIAFDRT